MQKQRGGILIIEEILIKAMALKQVCYTIAQRYGRNPFYDGQSIGLVFA